MKSYHIRVIDISKQNKFFRAFFIIAIPLYILVWFHFKHPFFDFSKTINSIVSYSILILPQIVLGFKMREIYTNEDVSFWEDEIHTKQVGPIKFSEMDKIQTPKTSFWSANAITIKLKAGQQISFAQSKYDLKITGARKRRNEFEDFVDEFEAQCEKRKLTR